MPSIVGAQGRQEESKACIKELYGSIKEIGAIFYQCLKHYICINSFNPQNNPVMMFIIFIETETMKPREVK